VRGCRRIRQHRLAADGRDGERRRSGLRWMPGEVS
jgi:hypothetical protein